MLRHIPPQGAGASVVSTNVLTVLIAYRPDFFVLGHNHALPYASGQSWNQKLGESRLLMPVNC
jgi:hypothetical protein